MPQAMVQLDGARRRVLKSASRGKNGFEKMRRCFCSHDSSEGIVLLDPVVTVTSYYPAHLSQP
jgi:hypothetical protein